MIPRRSTTVQTETIDDDLCVYDWARHEVHTLNATATRVWQLCDGRHTVGEIAARLTSTKGACLRPLCACR